MRNLVYAPVIALLHFLAVQVGDVEQLVIRLHRRGVVGNTLVLLPYELGQLGQVVVEAEVLEINYKAFLVAIADHPLHQLGILLLQSIDLLAQLEVEVVLQPVIIV